MTFFFFFFFFCFSISTRLWNHIWRLLKAYGPTYTLLGRAEIYFQNITFLQSAIVQCLYILQNNILFFIMTLVISGFLAVGDMEFSDPFTNGVE